MFWFIHALAAWSLTVRNFQMELCTTSVSIQGGFLWINSLAPSRHRAVKTIMLYTHSRNNPTLATSDGTRRTLYIF